MSMNSPFFVPTSGTADKASDVVPDSALDTAIAAKADAADLANLGSVVSGIISGDNAVGHALEADEADHAAEADHASISDTAQSAVTDGFGDTISSSYLRLDGSSLMAGNFELNGFNVNGADQVNTDNLASNNAGSITFLNPVDLNGNDVANIGDLQVDTSIQVTDTLLGTSGGIGMNGDGVETPNINVDSGQALGITGPVSFGDVATFEDGFCATLGSDSGSTFTINNFGTVYTGSAPATGTLISRPGNSIAIPVKNGGTGNLTVQRAGSDQLFLGTAVTSVVIPPGYSSIFFDDGTYWQVLFFRTPVTISTTAPLSGGGDLTASRTLVIAKSTGSVDGYLAASDFASFAAAAAAKATAGSFSATGTATTAFVVPIGQTMANTTYKVNVTPTSAVSAAVFYVTSKTTTQFTVMYLAGLTGGVSFDWSVFP